MRLEFEHSSMEYYSELDAVSISGSLLDSSTTDRLAFNLKAIAARIQRIGESLNSSTGDMNKMETSKVDNVIKNNNNSINNNSNNKASEEVTALQSQHHQLIENTCSGCWSSSSSSSSGVVTSFLDLPIDVLAIIILNLDLKSFFNLRSSCKALHQLCSDQRFFRHLDLQPFWNMVNFL